MTSIADLKVSDDLGMPQTEVHQMRKPYKGDGDFFDIKDLVAKEPFAQFQHWFDIACKTTGVIEANAMSLATATKQGKPSVRVVLMKGFDKKGIVFYTNYNSRKALELEENPYASVKFYWTNANDQSETIGGTWARQAENPHACVNFHWPSLMQQIRVEGTVEKVTNEESEEYFRTRPIPSQIGACVSEQSTPIASREVLTNKKTELEKIYLDGEKTLAKPAHWGGFRIKPDSFEFWQGQTNRLHDRILFRRQKDGEAIDPTITHTGEDGWLFERLSP